MKNILGNEGAALTEGTASALAEVRLAEHDMERGQLALTDKELESRPVAGTKDVWKKAKEDEFRRKMTALGMGNWIRALRFDIYRETREDQTVYVPLSFSTPYQVTPLEMQMMIERERTRPEVRNWLNYVLGGLNIGEHELTSLWFQWSQIKVVDMLEGPDLNERLIQTLHDLNPAVLQEAVVAKGLKAMADHEEKMAETGVETAIPAMASLNLWQDMTDEILDPDQKLYDQTILAAMVEICQPGQPEQKTIRFQISTGETVEVVIHRPVIPEATLDNAQENIDDAIYHEWGHVVAAFMRPEMFGEMVAIMQDPNLVPINALWVKNRIKSLLDVREFRWKSGMRKKPTANSDLWQQWKFYNELFADYWGIYTKARLRESHFCSDACSIGVPEALIPIFNQFFDEMIERNGPENGLSRCFLLTEQDKKNAMFFVQANMTAAMSTLTPIQAPIPDSLGQALVMLAQIQATRSALQNRPKPAAAKAKPHVATAPVAAARK